MYAEAWHGSRPAAFWSKVQQGWEVLLGTNRRVTCVVTSCHFGGLPGTLRAWNGDGIDISTSKVGRVITLQVRRVKKVGLWVCYGCQWIRRLIPALFLPPPLQASEQRQPRVNYVPSPRHGPCYASSRYVCSQGLRTTAMGRASGGAHTIFYCPGPARWRTPHLDSCTSTTTATLKTGRTCPDSPPAPVPPPIPAFDVPTYAWSLSFSPWWSVDWVMPCVFRPREP